MELKVGDRIKIINPNSKYYGYYGNIAKLPDSRHDNYALYLDNTNYNPYYCWYYKGERMCGSTISYQGKSFTKIDIYGGNDMNKKLTGYKRVAIINLNKDDQFLYALYDDDISVEDIVLVSGNYSGKLFKIAEIIPADDVMLNNQVITDEVMCKVDLTNYNNRITNRKCAEQLKLKMDEEIKRMQETDKYELYAEKNPQLAEMLAQYKELIG